MEVTRRFDYACRILRAAYNANGEYLSISTISEQEGIPYAFARNIQHLLLRADYVKTRRGAHGGLALNIDPADVTLHQLMRAFDIDISLAPCAITSDACERSHECGFNKVWCVASSLLVRYFDSLTLKDVIEGRVDADFAFASTPTDYKPSCPCSKNVSADEE